MVGGGVGRLLTFSAFRMGANSRLGAYSNKHRITILLGTLSNSGRQPEVDFLQHWAVVWLKPLGKSSL